MLWISRSRMMWRLLRLCLVMWNLLIPSLLSLLLSSSSDLLSQAISLLYLFHSFVDPSISTLLELKTCVIDALNLDGTLGLNMARGFQDWVQDLGFMPRFRILAASRTSRPLSSTLSGVGHTYNSYDWAQSFDKLNRAITSILMTCFLWNILLITNGFHFQNRLSSFNKLLRALMGIDISGNMMMKYSD